MFIKDLTSMFKNIYQKECSDEGLNINDLQARKIRNVNKRYLTKLYIEAMKLTTDRSKDFRTAFEQDILSIINNNKLPRRAENSNYKNIPVNKFYESIQDYHHIHEEKTRPKTLTTFTPKCDGTCCLNYEDLGPLSLEKGNWSSKCSDRHNNMECDPNVCGCKENCKNQSISRNIMKVLGDDVEERYAWGIDLFTFRNLLDFLPWNIDESHKASYISLHLLKSFSLLQRDGWNIKKACKYIYENIESYYSNIKDAKINISIEKIDVYYLSKHLFKLFSSCLNAKRNTTAYSKGMGIFCKKKEGIKSNELINTYLGEIYPPWYWFEKQDLIKKHKLDKELPDFYNIMLERLKTDESGYDVIFIDPNSKGNFSSRMSHSCEPNCNTVLMISNRQYTIGMFATKNITYQEELCFDYSSVTEKEKEFQEAICLCGSYGCRGHYLILENSLQLTDTLNDHHNFLNRNSILVKACEDQNLDFDDLRRLDTFSIRQSILGKAPQWLKKWAALILKFIEYELQLLPEILSNTNSDKLGKKMKNRKKLPSSLEEEIKNKDNNNNNNPDINKINGIENHIQINGNGIESNNNFRITNNINNDKKIITNGYGNYNIDNAHIKNGNNNEVYQKKVELIFNGRNINGGFIYKSLENSSNNINNNDINNIDNNHNNNEVRVEPKIEEKKQNGKDNILDKRNGNGINNNDYDAATIKNGELNGKLNGGLKNKDESKDLNIELANKKEEHNSNNEQNNNNSEENDDTSNTTKEKENSNENIIDERALEDKFKFDIMGIKENRIQNLAITIDKVIHVLELMNINDPPLIQLTEQEIFDTLWGDNNPNSLKSVLLKNFKGFLKLKYEKLDLIVTKVKEIIDIINNKDDEQFQDNKKIKIEKRNDYYSKQNKIFKNKLKMIALILITCSEIDKSKKFICFRPLSDVLLLYSKTNIYFKHNDSYSSSTNSETISILKRDINTFTSFSTIDNQVNRSNKTNQDNNRNKI